MHIKNADSEKLKDKRIIAIGDEIVAFFFFYSQVQAKTTSL